MSKSYEPDDLALRSYVITMASTFIFIAAAALFVY